MASFYKQGSVWDPETTVSPKPRPDRFTNTSTSGYDHVVIPWMAESCPRDHAWLFRGKIVMPIPGTGVHLRQGTSIVAPKRSSTWVIVTVGAIQLHTPNTASANIRGSIQTFIVDAESLPRWQFGGPEWALGGAFHLPRRWKVLRRIESGSVCTYKENANTSGWG